MVQFLPLPAIAYPQNAMINFQPVNQALQFYANNQLERGRFGLQQNADMREQDMHPLNMDYRRAQTGLTQAQTQGAIGQEERAVRREPYDLRYVTAQTNQANAGAGLSTAQAAAVRDRNSRENDLHQPALGMANLNYNTAQLNRDQQTAALLAMAPNEAQHAMVLRVLRSRGYAIPPGMDTYQGAQNGAAAAGPALIAAQTASANLDRLDPRRMTGRLLDAARGVGWDVNSPRGPTPGQAFGLTGQIPQARPMSPHEMTQIDNADQAVQSGNNALSTLDQALTLSAGAMSGPGAGFRGRVGDAVGMTSGTNTVLLDNMLSRQAVGQLRTLFGANPTEGERAILLQLEGNSSMSRAARERLIGDSMEAARQRIAYNTIVADAIRRGDYYTTSFSANTNYVALLNRLRQGQGAGGAQGGGQPAPSGSPAPRPTPAPQGPNGSGGRDHGALTRDTLPQMAARMRPGDTFTLNGNTWRVIGPNQYQAVR